MRRFSLLRNLRLEQAVLERSRYLGEIRALAEREKRRREAAIARLQKRKGQWK